MPWKRLSTVLILFGLLLGLGAPLAVSAAKEKGKKAKAPSVDDQPDPVWPPPPAPAKIKWVGEWRNEFDVGAKKRRSFVDRLAGKSEDVIWLKRPMAVAVDEKGTVFVGDFGQGIVAIDAEGKRMWRFSDVSKTALGTPVGVAVDSQLLFATDANTDRVVLFDKAGQSLASLGPSDGIKRPVGIAVDEGRNLVVVVNGGDHNILLLDRKLKILKKIGKRGGDPGQFNFPTYCCMVPGVGFAVADAGNFRVQILNYEGKFVRSFGQAGDYTGCFARPKGVAVDPDGQLYVVDPVFANFQVFRIDGQILTFVGQGGPGKGQFQSPCGIAISQSGAIFVADSINGRIQRFQYLVKGGEEGDRPSPVVR
jgi:DNA-binding beta-propeller fold protein YncE